MYAFLDTRIRHISTLFCQRINLDKTMIKRISVDNPPHLMNYSTFGLLRKKSLIMIELTNFSLVFVFDLQTDNRRPTLMTVVL